MRTLRTYLLTNFPVYHRALLAIVVLCIPSLGLIYFIIGSFYL